MNNQVYTRCLSLVKLSSTLAIRNEQSLSLALFLPSGSITYVEVLYLALSVSTSSLSLSLSHVLKCCPFPSLLTTAGIPVLYSKYHIHMYMCVCACTSNIMITGIGTVHCKNRFVIFTQIVITTNCHSDNALLKQQFFVVLTYFFVKLSNNLITKIKN